jgi:hypothetical protein
MTNFQKTQAQIDSELDTQRSGSALLATGWTLLGMVFLLSIYTFSAIREGTPSWLYFEGVIGVIGLLLVGMGTMRRRRSC